MSWDGHPLLHTPIQLETSLLEKAINKIMHTLSHQISPRGLICKNEILGWAYLRGGGIIQGGSYFKL